MTTKKRDFLEGTSVQLCLWGREFARIDEQLAEGPATAPEELRRRLSALKRRKRQLERQLLAAAQTTRVEWEQVREQLEAALRQFRATAARVYNQSRRLSA